MSLLQAPTFFCVEEIQQEVGRLLGGENMKFVSVFNIHDFIADVIGSFNKVSQRKTSVTDFVAIVTERQQLQFVGNFVKKRCLAFEKSEFGFALRHQRGVRIFHDGGQYAVCHDVTSCT